MSYNQKYYTKEESEEANRQKTLKRYYKNREKVREKQKEYYQKNREIVNQHKNGQALLNLNLYLAAQQPSVIFEVIEEKPTIQIDQNQIDKLLQTGTIVNPIYSN